MELYISYSFSIWKRQICFNHCKVYWNTDQISISLYGYSYWITYHNTVHVHVTVVNIISLQLYHTTVHVSTETLTRYLSVCMAITIELIIITAIIKTLNQLQSRRYPTYISLKWSSLNLLGNMIINKIQLWTRWLLCNHCWWLEFSKT